MIISVKFVLFLLHFSNEAKTPKHLLSNVVYKFTCQNYFELTYIGETKRHLLTRVKEHLSLSNSYQNSEVKTHIENCSQCISMAVLIHFKLLRSA